MTTSSLSFSYIFPTFRALLHFITSLLPNFLHYFVILFFSIFCFYTISTLTISSLSFSYIFPTFSALLHFITSLLPNFLHYFVILTYPDLKLYGISKPFLLIYGIF